MQSRTIQILSALLFALLLIWGGYTLLVYLGIPYHGAALIPEAAMDGVAAACDSNAYVCRGIATLQPFVVHTIRRSSPFLGYLILCALAYALFVGWTWIARGDWKKIRVRWTPWKLLLLFVVLTWLLSSVISFGSSGGRAQQFYIEPTAASYNVSESALETLQRDYRRLLDRGCLTLLGETETGARGYNLRAWCIQEAFVTRVLTQALFIFLFLGELLVFGRMTVQWVFRRIARFLGVSRTPFPSLLLETVFCAAAGAVMGIILLWTIAVTGYYTTAAGWIAAIVIPAVGWRHTVYWVKTFLFHETEREYDVWNAGLFLGWLLLSLLAINFLEVVRPFPIGWDDLGSYLNRPRLLVSYGHFIAPMSTFDWSYLTSLGFLLFGYNATFGSTAAMMVNWSQGLLAVAAIFAIARTLLGHRAGALSALLYYILPLVGHFSFADMKIDNAVFFFTAMGVFCVLLALAPPHDEPETEHPEHDRRMKEAWSIGLLFLSGAFLGIAFSTKSTAAMGILAAGSMILGMTIHGLAYAGGLLFAFAAFAQQGVFSVRAIIERVTGTLPGNGAVMIFVAICILAGLGFLAAGFFVRRPSVRSLAGILGAFAAGVLITVGPWMEHNNIEAGNLMPSFALSAPNKFAPQVDVKKLPPELAVDPASPSCTPTGSIEELGRYWGFEQGWRHYVTLPWRTVMNIDATGYYVTTFPILLLFPLLLLLPFFWMKKGRWLRWLFLGTCMMIVEWMFLANGIPWYGIGILLGIVIGLEAFIAKAPDLPNRIVASILVGFSILMAFGMRMWQFEQQRNIFEYSMGKVSAEALRDITIPHYEPIREAIVERHETMPDRPYVYRVGTFIPYFIPKNLEIIGVSDSQLDLFNCIHQERNPELTVRRLKALGFNSVVFDTNTATIERDEQGSLHKKVGAFVDFVNDPKANLQVVVSDTNAGIAFILIP